MQLRANSMMARRLGRWMLIAATALAAITMILETASGQQMPPGGGGPGGFASYCAQTPDPAVCQQLLNSAISKGIVPQGASSGQIPVPGQTPGEVNGIVQGPPPSVTVTPTPQEAKKPPRERSNLEEIYSKRAGTELHQYGYDLIGNGGTISALQIGAIQDDYILGQGDAIIVTMRGQENDTYNAFVDRDGNVTLPRLRPISASGRRFGDFRAELDAAIKQGFLQTQAYITMGQVRQISVNVVGEVTNPGVYALSGLSSMLDALNVAGGIRKSGSLRKILVDRDGRTISIDLYKFLSSDGVAPNTTLRQGDKIIVGPLGATVAISGEVRRPGIYELPVGSHAASVHALLSLANGYDIRGSYRLTIIRTRADGTQEYVDTTARPGAEVVDGETLVVNSAANYTSGEVTLEGNVRLPGNYALDRARTLRELLPDAQAFLPQTYMPFGFILRENPKTLERTVIPFSVQLLIEGKFNEPLQSQDVVHILTFGAMRSLAALRSNPEAAQTDLKGSNAAAGQTGNAAAGQSGIGGTTTPGGFMAPGSTSAGTQAGEGTSAAGNGETAGTNASVGAESTIGGIEGLTAEESATVGFVVTDYKVELDGAVREPGDYLAVPGASLDELIIAANGLKPDADLNAVEVTSVAIDNVGGLAVSSRKTYALTPQTLSSVSLHRLDEVHIPAVMLDQEDGTIEVSGEVQFPGSFHLLRGERLSSVLQRAGGLTKQAYPIGAIFLRSSVAKVRETAYQQEADDLQKQLVATVAQAGSALSSANGQSGGFSAESAVFLSDVIRQLRTKAADGRMSIVADPAALAATPQADIELQPGDKLIIPKRPSEVDVTGEVLNAGSFRFVPQLDVADYIGMAGGYDRYADEDHIFIVNPDGTARQVSDDLFDFHSSKLAPGSVVVVPRDLRPLDLGVLTVTLSKILSDLAISAASVAVLSKNN
jgi:polysaccharide export outer membrane protein